MIHRSYERLLDLCASPRNRTRLETADFSHEEMNLLCGDVIRMDVQLNRQGRVIRAAWDGDGCLISFAAAELLADAVKGLTLEEIRAFPEAQLLAMIDVPLNKAREQCALLPLEVLKNGARRFTTPTGLYLERATVGNYRHERPV